MISVITPTFNRAYILPKCYESLCEQSNDDFEWIVVDDGSTDKTEALISDYISENKIKIKYFRQGNGGKHRAHNLAVKNASGELCVCLDSDDMLSKDAIDTAINIWKTKHRLDTIGILALRGDMDSHKPICSQIPDNLELSTMTDLRDRYGFQGDTILFFRTSLLKEIPFVEFEGEKFLPENNLYCDLDLKGKMILLNQVLYYCEYRPDGLTAKYHKLLFDNPKGTAHTYYKMALMADNIPTAFKYAIISRAYNNLLPKSSAHRYPERRILMFLSKLAAPIFAYKYLRKFKK